MQQLYLTGGGHFRAAGPERHIKKRNSLWWYFMTLCSLLDTVGKHLSSDPPTFNTYKNSDGSYLHSRRTLCNVAFARV